MNEHPAFWISVAVLVVAPAAAVFIGVGCIRAVVHGHARQAARGLVVTMILLGATAIIAAAVGAPGTATGLLLRLPTG